MAVMTGDYELRLNKEELSVYPPSGIIPVDASIARRASDLLNTMKSLADNQPDLGWPCRCRSFLIEILFLLSRLYDCPKPEDISQVSIPAESVRPIILYMSKYYCRKLKLDEITKEFHTNKTSLNEKRWESKRLKRFRNWL